MGWVAYLVLQNGLKIQHVAQQWSTFINAKCEVVAETTLDLTHLLDTQWQETQCPLELLWTL